ncbi:MAG: hypothetical protein ACRC7C_19905 [Beijerinckiaceae bacterium]
MKFTLDASGAQQAGQGIGSLFKAYALGPQMRQQAEMDAVGSMAKIGQAQAVARKYNADADLDIHKRSLQQDPLQTAMLQHGLPTSLAPAFKNKLETGSFGYPYETPADGVGPTQPAPADNDTVAKLGQSMALMQRMYGSGSNVDQMAGAGLKEQQMRQIDEAVRNPAMVDRIGAAQAAGSGKVYDLYNSVGSTGGTMNKRTGDAGPVDSRIAKIFGMVEQAKAGASNASAANSYSAAAENRAQTQKIRQEIEMGGKGVLQQTDQGLMLVDPRSGTARPVTGAGGAPLSGKVKDLNEGQAKDNLYASRMQEADGIISKLTGKYSPSTVNGRMAVAEVPVVGMAANWLQSEEGQKAEQAQRDFINAVLRRESGAVISPGEFNNAKLQYFPQPNDKPENLKQKARNRQIAIEGVYGSVPVSRRGVPSLTSPATGGTQAGATGQWGESTAQAGPSSIKSDDEYNALPSGAVFTAPDGSQRRKP